jgi:hypothetical protein
LTWVLGLTRELDPLQPVHNLTQLLPDLVNGETFVQWQARTLSAPRDATTVAAMLDLHYCLDWAYLKLEGTPRGADPEGWAVGEGLPGDIDANAIGQRRWALEWSVTFIGPHHDPPGGWEEVDLSTS